MKLDYTYTTEYKAIIKDYIAIVEKLRDFKKWNTIESVVSETIDKMKQSLASRYKTYKEERMNKLEQSMERIEKRYKNTRNIYADPQIEILRRQDFDLEFSLLDRNGVLALLDDENRDFTDYELKKMKVAFPDDFKIAQALELRKLHHDQAYEQNPEYQTLRQEYSTLKMIHGMGLSFVYIPDDSEKGYSNYDFDLKVGKQSLSGLEYEIERMTQLVNGIKAEEKEQYERLQAAFEKVYQSEARAKGYKYPEFDQRIFKGAPGYDVTHRFQYLKERLDDTTTNRFDPMRDDYDTWEHYQFLENKHNLKLKNNSDYAARYKAAEVQALSKE